MKEIKINTAEIQLDQLLKWANIVMSGGEAKHLIQNSRVLVNGNIETRRAHKIRPGDRIRVLDRLEFIVGSGL
ncbi:MAG: RNA-binding S4 domain-containing protein [Firmicutes bacterium]|nr:RNA-binding S4 domain-containing protein [Bacillota bacterium]